MSSIKFRGLHPSAKVIMDVCVIDWMHDEVYFEQGTDVSYPINECNLIQYTGLKDKNGVEIYEGDIVRQVRKDCCYGGDDEVEVVLIKTPVYWDLTSRPSGGPDGSYPIIKMEVIGNIHQNPELLEVRP